MSSLFWYGCGWAHDSPGGRSSIAVWSVTEATHTKRTWQEDTMPKKPTSFQDCMFWHTFTFTCHSTLVHPISGNLKENLMRRLAAWGQLLRPWEPMQKAEWIQQWPDGFFQRTSQFHKLEGQWPYTITHFPRGHIFLSCMSPLTLPINCITIIIIIIIQKNKTEAKLYPTFGIYSKAIKLACLQPSQIPCQEDSGFNDMYIYILICTQTKKLLFQLEKKLNFITEWIL